MTTMVNKVRCGTSLGNTGVGGCPFDPGIIRGAISMPQGRQLTPADVAAIEATITTGILAPPASRFYPIAKFEQITDNSEDVTIATLGYGGKALVKFGDYDWTFQFTEGALCLLKSLGSHRKAKRDFLFIDDNGKIIGTKVGDNIQGIPAIFFALPWKPADGSNPAVYLVRFIFKSKYLTEQIGFIDPPASFDAAALDGLQDIILKKVTGSTGMSVKLTATTGCDMSDLGALFNTLFTTAATWIGIKADGTTLVPTAVAYAAAADPTDPGTFTLTFSAAVVSVTTIAALALSTAGADGYESNVLTPVV